MGRLNETFTGKEDDSKPFHLPLLREDLKHPLWPSYKGKMALCISLRLLVESMLYDDCVKGMIACCFPVNAVTMKNHKTRATNVAVPRAMETILLRLIPTAIFSSGGVGHSAIRNTKRPLTICPHRRQIGVTKAVAAKIIITAIRNRMIIFHRHQAAATKAVAAKRIPSSPVKIQTDTLPNRAAGAFNGRPFSRWGPGCWVLWGKTVRGVCCLVSPSSL
jgi:hypothetical protein